jgi:hypothetical protein
MRWSDGRMRMDWLRASKAVLRRRAALLPMMRMLPRTRICVVAVAYCAACSQSWVSPDVPDMPKNGGPGDAANPGDALAVDNGGTGGSGGCQQICYVDYPCWVEGFTRRCLAGDPQILLTGHDLSCLEVCGTPCCSGGACQVRAEPCEAGTKCAYLNLEPEPPFLAQCVNESQVCTGAVDAGCPDGQYCEVAGVLCSSASVSGCWNASACAYADAGGLGTCRPFPTPEQCNAKAGKVCGCDGVTYEDDCKRRRAGVPRAYKGPCS